jgi:F0F1-type ATP synthase assembly protein I
MAETTGNGGHGRDQRGAAGGSVAEARPSAKSDSEAEVAIGWKLAGLGFQVASEVGAGALLGWLVDGWLNSAPTGLLVGSIAGIAVGLWSLIRGALRLNRQLDSISLRRKAEAGAGAGTGTGMTLSPEVREHDSWNDDSDAGTDERDSEDDKRW